MCRSFSDCRLCGVDLSLHGGQAVALRFVTVGPGVVKRLHLRSRSVLVAGRLFPNQVPTVVEQVTGQQETRQREDEQAQVDLKEDAAENPSVKACRCCLCH